MDGTKSAVIGKGVFHISLTPSPITVSILNEALHDARPSGVGRYYSVKKGQFDSAIEWGRGVWLFDAQRKGLISNLSHHSIITFESDGNVIKYEADFTYYCNNCLYIEDVKPGKLKKNCKRAGSVMAVGGEYLEKNQHLRGVILDGSLHRINFLLMASNLKITIIPILASASFFRDSTNLTLSF